MGPICTRVKYRATQRHFRQWYTGLPAAKPQAVLLACFCVAHQCRCCCCRALQSDDPARDFRGAGLYGLDNLLYMGTHHPVLFKQLMLKSQVSCWAPVAQALHVCGEPCMPLCCAML